MVPRVSIVIPSYQQAGYLRTAIDSVLAQDYEPLDVMVLDGGSTDDSVAILESYGDRIWWRSQKDGGQCQAINEGFRRATGEIVAWLNSDDFYYPGAVRTAVAALVANPEAGMVYGEGDLVDSSGEVIRRFPGIGQVGPVHNAKAIVEPLFSAFRTPQMQLADQRAVVTRFREQAGHKFLVAREVAGAVTVDVV